MPSLASTRPASFGPPVRLWRDAPARIRFPAVVLLAAAVQALFLHAYLLRGGLFIDDWPLAATQHFLGTGGLLGELAHADHQRPLGFIYLTLTTAVSGTSPQLHALWGFVTHLMCVVTVAWAARELGMPPLGSAIFGLLVMVFPFSDSIWLWYAASHISLAIAFGAIGVVLGLRGLRATRAWPWHLAAAAMFVASVLTYQVIAVAIVLMLAVYWPRTCHRRALELWAKDIAAVVCASGLPSLITGSRGSQAAPALPLSDLVHHASLMLTQGGSLLAVSLVPLGAAHRNIVAPAAVLIGTASAVLAARGHGEVRDHARRWLGWAITGAAVVVTAFALFVPASFFYVPLAQGQGNRVNALAGIGYCLIALSLAMLLAGLLTPRRLRRWTTTIGVLFTVPILIGYVHRIDRDMRLWNNAADIQHEELGALVRVGRPAPGTTDFVGGGIGESTPGVFVFGWVPDLNAAAQLAWNDDTVHTWPLLSQVPLECTSTGVVPRSNWFGYGPQQAATYPRVMFTDLRTGTRVTVRDLAQCRQALATVTPFPPQP